MDFTILTRISIDSESGQSIISQNTGDNTVEDRSHEVGTGAFDRIRGEEIMHHKGDTAIIHSFRILLSPHLGSAEGNRFWRTFWPTEMEYSRTCTTIFNPGKTL